MIRENREEFGLGCHSVAAKYHRRNAEALIYSLNNRKTRHKNATKALLTYQVESLKAEALELLAQHKPRSLPLRCSLAFTMRACQLLSIEISGTFIVKNSAPQYSEDLKWLSSLALSDHVTYNLENLVYVIARDPWLPWASIPLPIYLKQMPHMWFQEQQCMKYLGMLAQRGYS